MTHYLGALTPVTASFISCGAMVIASVVVSALMTIKSITGQEPVKPNFYFTAGITQHIFGLAGGFIWALGTISNFLAADVLGFAMIFAIGNSAPLVAALWGTLVWKEFKGASCKVYIFLNLMFFFFAAGIALIVLSHKI